MQSVEGAPNQDATDIMRLKYALVRTTYAVFNTSFTTSMAFFATAISPIMPISTFGVFSAVVKLSTTYIDFDCVTFVEGNNCPSLC